MPYIRYLIPEITYPMPICRTYMVVIQVNLFHIAYLTTEPYHGIFDWVISTGYYPACGRRKTFKIKGGSAKIPSLLSNQTISGLLVLLATSYLFLSQPETKTRAVNASGGAAHKLTWCCSSFLPKIFLSLSTGRLCQTRKGGCHLRSYRDRGALTAGIQNLNISIDRDFIFVPEEFFLKNDAIFFGTKARQTIWWLYSHFTFLVEGRRNFLQVLLVGRLSTRAGETYQLWKARPSL